MKRIVLGISVLLMLVQNGFASDYSHMDTKWFQEVLKCEKEAGSRESLKTATVQYCLNVIDILKDRNNRTDKEQEYLAESYYNAGVIYGMGLKYKKAKLEVKMYQKAIKHGSCEYSDNCSVKNNLAYSYHFGDGVSKNHIKAYELYKSALKNGNASAQKGLEQLCKQSPWACK